MPQAGMKGAVGAQQKFLLQEIYDFWLNRLLL